MVSDGAWAPSMTLQGIAGCQVSVCESNPDMERPHKVMVISRERPAWGTEEREAIREKLSCPDPVEVRG